MSGKVSTPTDAPRSVLTTGKLNDTPASGKKGTNGTTAAAGDPARFNGDGVSFKAKLIGYEDVPEARGEKMCQVSMAKLKAVVVAMKEHKRPISVNVSMEGIRLIDEKTEEILHTHLVHRISFIYRDTSDSRAFGYVYHREDSTHQFFAIKTDKAADLTVSCLKDLFEIVFVMKKKEGEEVFEKRDETTTSNNNSNNNNSDNKTTTAAGSEADREQVLEPPAPAAPPSRDLLALDEQQQSERATGTKSNAWILSAYAQTNHAQQHGSGGYPGVGAVSYPGHQPVVMMPPPVPAPGYQYPYQAPPQAFQTPGNQAVSGAWGPATPFSNGFPPVAAAAHPAAVQQRTTSTGPTFSSPPFVGGGSGGVDPFKSDPFFSPISHTPLTAQAGSNASHSMSFNQSTVSSSSGSMLLEISTENSTVFNNAFTETPSQAQGQQAPAARPPGPDPFADLANLRLTPTTVPLPPNKKVSKQDFIRDPPKPSLLDLSQQQQQKQQQLLQLGTESATVTAAPAANSNALDPFSVAQATTTTNPFAAISPDDPFA